ncbi:hypothetical protein HPG69_016191 [Diceros bicornis minor]|uniref:Uncharacterized protein n=1 Tax=Diceros bicornis minor TaxID=77932 RepID=A0A7J7FHI7_DICBM|nr:hypothetical protein HPG69_016191 [Diceros bicornis minor]
MGSDYSLEIVTKALYCTKCLSPLAKVVHDNFGFVKHNSDHQFQCGGGWKTKDGPLAVALWPRCCPEHWPCIHWHSPCCGQPSQS